MPVWSGRANSPICDPQKRGAPFLTLPGALIVAVCDAAFAFPRLTSAET